MSRQTPYNFRRFLEETPMTDSQIAEAVGVNHSTVYRWRTGKATPSTAKMDQVIEYAREHWRKQRARLDAVEDYLEEERRAYAPVDAASNGRVS